MFSSMMLGVYTNTADATTPTAAENDRFVHGSVQGLGSAVQMIFSPYELLMGKVLKRETAAMRHCFEGFDEAWSIAQDKVQSFIERQKRGELTPNEQSSYLARAFKRQKEDGSNVSVREVVEIAFAGLFAAVDTTSSVLGWNLFHIARLPNVQQKLYEELSASLKEHGENGEITVDVISKGNAPYLHAVIRETHRVTPTSCIGIANKTIDVDEMEVHGHRMVRGDIIGLESYTVGMNPELVDRPDVFFPERWLPDAVEERKGSLREVIDHPFLAAPFSQGARKCPGSRVASNEVKVLLSQLVLDWRITSPVTCLEDIEYRQKTTLEIKMPDLRFEPRH